MKFFAFYLPQFHEIEENNRWWGKGFTDWDNVKKARPLHRKHRQPRIPETGYYDLSRAEDIKKQAELARKYNVDGFCIYHYWFGGKLLLEKPVELIRQNPDIDIEYCFSWANEPWARTWDGKNNDLLIAQNYGGEEDWKAHFEYFLPYFKDSRYVKINNKPMVVIYKYASIPDFDKMADCWRKMAVENGFDGIHLVETLRDRTAYNDSDLFDAHVEFEPAYSRSQMSKFTLWKNRVVRYSKLAIYKLLRQNKNANRPVPYSEIANTSIKRVHRPNTYGGAFLGWDNTPRKKMLGTIITEPTKEQFRNVLLAKGKAVNRDNDENNRFIFINAWNEWAEGTYLEPDTVNKYMYLEAVKEASEML